MKSKVNLIEYVHPKMDLLFVALNAPEVSNANAHWFSYNLSFWNLLFKAGVITQTISDPKEGDVKVFGDNVINYNNWIIGVTDLNREVVSTKSNQVITDISQVQRILSIIEKNTVKKICLKHSMVADEFESNGIIVRNNKKGANEFGIVGKYKSTVIYEVPFHNASIGNKVKYYQMLLGTNTNFKKEPIFVIDKILRKPSVRSEKTIITSNSIVLPSKGNSITKADISKGTLRITVDAKPWFPQQNTTIKLHIEGTIIVANYTKRDGRSDLLKIGKSIFASIGLKLTDRLKFKRVKPNEFTVEKI